MPQEISLSNDARWQRFQEIGWVCATCGERHKGVFDLACGKPDYWPGSGEQGPNSLVASSTHFLSEDFCVLDGEHHFVRCVLDLPIIGADGDSFAFGVWSSLSAENFARYVDGFDSGDYGDAGPWFGWFSNNLKGYPETLGLKCRVHPRPGRDRPAIELEPSDHPLAHDHSNGITFDRLLEIYAMNGHEMGDMLR